MSEVVTPIIYTTSRIPIKGRTKRKGNHYFFFIVIENFFLIFRWTSNWITYSFSIIKRQRTGDEKTLTIKWKFIDDYIFVENNFTDWMFRKEFY